MFYRCLVGRHILVALRFFACVWRLARLAGGVGRVVAGGGAEPVLHLGVWLVAAFAEKARARDRRSAAGAAFCCAMVAGRAVPRGVIHGLSLGGDWLCPCRWLAGRLRAVVGCVWHVGFGRRGVGCGVAIAAVHQATVSAHICRAGRRRFRPFRVVGCRCHSGRVCCSITHGRLAQANLGQQAATAGNGQWPVGGFAARQYPARRKIPAQ